MTVTAEERLKSARDYVASGLSLVPIAAKSKAPPINWKPYQTRKPTDAELPVWVKKYPGLGIVGGQVSGKDGAALEILDIEAIAPIEEFCELVDEAAPGLLARLPRDKTPTDGRHLFYRCEVVAGNQKLAQRAEEVADADLPRLADGALDLEAVKKDGLREIGGKYFKIRTLIETRGEGGQVLSPLCLPGTHPSGGVYELLNGDLCDIPTITARERDILLTAARACNEWVDPVKAKGAREAKAGGGRGPKPGEDYNGRSDTFSKTLDLLKDHGWTVFRDQNMGPLLSRPGVTNHCSARLFNSGALYVFSSNAGPFNIEESYSPFGVYAELRHNGDYPMAAKALAAAGYGDQSKRQAKQAGDEKAGTDGAKEKTDDSWGQPQPIPDGLLPVPQLPVALIPAAFRGWIHDIATRLQVPLDFPAVPAIVAAASVIGNQVRIRPKAHDDWTVTPNLWGAIVGRPGTMKSPAILEAIKPLNRLVAKAKKEHEEALRAWKFEKESAEIRRAAKRDEMKKAAKRGSDLEEFRDELAGDDAKEPTERRYITNDATVEKYGELLNQNPNGLLIQRDELTGWLRSLDDEGRAKDRSFYLEAANGAGDYTYDRIGRGTLYIKSITTSIIGGIQPGPLQTYLRGTLGFGEGDDGLIQRFQVTTYPDLPPGWTYIDRWPDSEARKTAFEVFEALADLPDTLGFERDDGASAFMRFAPEAQKFFEGWYTDLMGDVRSGAFEHPAIESHFVKYGRLMPALALIFEMVNAAARAFEPFEPSVSEESAKLAAAWCQFLMAHAKRIYGLGIAATEMRARALAVHIQNGEVKPSLPEGFTARDVYLKHWAGLNTAELVAEPLEMLEYLGWIRGAFLSKGGRPTTAYQINPRVSEVKL
jgi:putative DNA primase/helicase